MQFIAKMVLKVIVHCVRATEAFKEVLEKVVMHFVEMSSHCKQTYSLVCEAHAESQYNCVPMSTKNLTTSGVPFQTFDRPTHRYVQWYDRYLPSLRAPSYPR